MRRELPSVSSQGMKPFRTVPTPTVSSPVAQPASPPKADVFRRAVIDGEELYDAAKERSAPDHSPAIPWPAPDPGAPKPMRLK